MGDSDGKSFYLQRCWSLVCVLLRVAGFPCYLRLRWLVRLVQQEGARVHRKPGCQCSVILKLALGQQPEAAFWHDAVATISGTVVPPLCETPWQATAQDKHVFTVHLKPVLLSSCAHDALSRP